MSSKERPCSSHSVQSLSSCSSSSDNEKQCLVSRKPPKVYPKWRRVLIFSCCFLSIFAQNLYYSMPLPFLSNEVIEVRGYTPLVAGVLVGVFSLSIALSSLLSQKISALCTSRTTLLLSTGVLILSTTPFLFTMSDPVFVIVCFIVRVVQGSALGISEPQIVSTMSTLFPEWLGTVTATYELAFSLSLMVGPMMGGFLYQLGGFYLPMVTASGLAGVVGLFGILAMPHLKTDHDDNDTVSDFKALWTFPTVMLGVNLMVTVSAVAGLVEGFFANYYLQTYDKGEYVAGLALTIGGLLYSLSTVVNGYYGDVCQSRRSFIITGLLIMALCSGCIDLSVFGMERLGYLWPGFMFGGLEVGSAMVQVSTLPLMIFHYELTTVQSIGDATCHMTGVYNFGFFMGAFVGPIVGGLLLNFLTYAQCFLTLSFLVVVQLCVIIISNCYYHSLLSILK